MSDGSHQIIDDCQPTPAVFLWRRSGARWENRKIGENGIILLREQIAFFPETFFMTE